MDKYVYGSSAYKIEDDIYTQTDSAREESERQAVQRRSARRSFRLHIFICGIILFMLAAGTVYSKVLVMQAAGSVETKREELMQLIEENNKKRIDIEQGIDLKKVEELAITQYGMQRPDKNQTIYVNVVQKDYGEVVSR